jgi:hypothetical protein
MKSSAFAGKVFVGGGYLRSLVAGESVSDIDIFVGSKDDGYALAQMLVKLKLGLRPIVSADDILAHQNSEEKVASNIHETDNAFTLTCYRPVIQIIHRWTFSTGPDVANSFDFSVCCAVFWWETPGWSSFCHDSFYPDLAARRLIYLSPQRNEDAGGSILRVLKYLKRGYNIPLESLAAVIARLTKGVDWEQIDKYNDRESETARVILGLLREVDPGVADLVTREGE